MRLQTRFAVRQRRGSIGAAVVALMFAATVLNAQHQGAMVMGFDQQKTTHHFHLYRDGGAIDVSVNDVTDTVNRDGIRAHLSHIAMLFGQGNFESPMLVHDSTNVPGTAKMARLKERISFKYSETPSGGRVDIVTTNASALKAVHEFLKFQIAEHKTGDTIDIKKR